MAERVAAGAVAPLFGASGCDGWGLAKMRYMLLLFILMYQYLLFSIECQIFYVYLHF